MLTETDAIYAGIAATGLQRHMGLMGAAMNAVTANILRQKASVLAERVVQAACMPLPHDSSWSYMKSWSLTDPPAALASKLSEGKPLWELSSSLLAETQAVYEDHKRQQAFASAKSSGC